MKSRQFCSVCKQYLEMEVVPTGDGDDDGVIWFRCPQCQGFLPKLGGALAEESGDESGGETGEDASTKETAAAEGASASADTAKPAADATTTEEQRAGETAANADLPWDSPADMMDARSGSDTAPVSAEDPAAETPPEETAEPIAEYASLLAEQNPEEAVPYRPWQTYEVGQCVHHLAWDDCGVVVAKEDLPGGRHVIKCYFSEAGVVRLIEQAPR